MTDQGNMDLTSAQIKRLRAEAHRLNLKPVVIVGQKGLSENLHDEIDSALDHHELIKLRVPASGKDSKRELASRLCDRHEAALIQSIGGVLVIYRRNPEINRFSALLGA